MDEENFNENLLLLLFLLLKVRKLRKSKCKKNNRRRLSKFWVRNIFKKREELGEYHHLIQEMRNNDREYFFSRYNFITIIIFVFVPFSHGGNKRSHIL